MVTKTAVKFYIPILFIYIELIAAPAFGAIYLTKDEALKLVCGSKATYSEDTKSISKELKEDLDSHGFGLSDGDSAYFFKCLESGLVTGYAIIDNEIGKHLPLTYIVGITPKGEVSRVELMVFRESIGSEIKKRKFMEQFEKKEITDPISIGTDIQHVTGATISSRSITKGVRRALYLWNNFYGKEIK